MSQQKYVFWATYWATFSQTRLVTLLGRSPKQEKMQKWERDPLH
jgi:hypothetical protein